MKTYRVCSCVQEFKGSWTEIGPHRICLFGTGERLSAQKRCTWCDGTGIVTKSSVPDIPHIPPLPPRPDKGAGGGPPRERPAPKPRPGSSRVYKVRERKSYASIEDDLDEIYQDQRAEQSAWRASAGGEIDGQTVIFEAEAPTAQEACDLLWMIQGKGGAR